MLRRTELTFPPRSTPTPPMICNRREDGWELVYQNAHGVVAMELLRHWRAPDRPGGSPGRWGEVLYAAAQHDNGWQEWEPGDHLTALGTPRHFEETTDADIVRQSEMALGRVRHASLFAGLLLIEHFRTLYAASEDADTQAMLRRQTAEAAKYRRVLDVSAQDVKAHYEYLRFADTLSLTLCLRRLDLMADRRIEIETVGGVRYFAFRRADESICVEPWPYDVASFDVSAEAYHLPALTFESNDALAAAVADARIVPRVWTVRRG